MKYKYTAVNAKGIAKSGSLNAENEQEAVARLREQRLVPTRLVPAGRLEQAQLGLDGEGPKKWYEVEVLEKDIHQQHFARKKLSVVFTQLAIMLRAGVNLSLALEVMADNEPHKRFKKVLRELHADLLGGIGLSQSMSKFVCFDSVCVNLVRAGEADGHLERSFAQISTVLEKQQKLQSKVVSAAIYPIILLVMVIAVLSIINTMVLPSFVTMFEAIGTGLPTITVLVMSFSQWFNRWWWLVILLVLIAVFGYRAMRKKSQKFALKIDEFKLHIPLAGKLIRQSSIARFSRILAALLESGQDFLSSLNIGRSVITNEAIAGGLAKVADDVRVGNPISASMQKLWFFDPVYISMLRAGEESGSLSTTLGKMAEMYELETDATTQRLTTMMEPLMTVLISIIVGIVVVAIALPMFGMFNLVGSV